METPQPARVGELFVVRKICVVVFALTRSVSVFRAQIWYLAGCLDCGMRFDAVCAKAPLCKGSCQRS